MTQRGSQPSHDAAGKPAVAGRWVAVCRVADVPTDTGKYVTVGRASIALFKLPSGELRAIADTCPHAGASLSAGPFDARSNCVTCTMHAWPFDVSTGQCPDNPSIAVKVYATRTVNGVVEIWVG